MAKFLISHAWTQSSCGSLSNPFREWTKCLFHRCKCGTKSPQSTWYNSDCFLHLMSGRRFRQDTDVFRSALLLHIECNQKNIRKTQTRGPVDCQPGIFRESSIGRLYTVHPNLDECFFLRMLLVNVPGPRSFQQLKIVDGLTHVTFRAACHALNLLENGQYRYCPSKPNSRITQYYIERLLPFVFHRGMSKISIAYGWGYFA